MGNNRDEDRQVEVLLQEEERLESKEMAEITSDNVISAVSTQVSATQQTRRPKHHKHTQTDTDRTSAFSSYIAMYTIQKISGIQFDDSVWSKICPIRVCHHIEMAAEVMLDHVYGVLDRFSKVMTSNVQKSKIDPSNALASFQVLANAMLEPDEGISWKQIVFLYAFGARLVLHCKQGDMREHASEIALIFGQFIGDRIAPWVDRHGGWMQFQKEYGDGGTPVEPRLEDKIWKSLLSTFVVLGTSAIVLFLVRGVKK